MTFLFPIIYFLFISISSFDSIFVSFFHPPRLYPTLSILHCRQHLFSSSNNSLSFFLFFRMGASPATSSLRSTDDVGSQINLNIEGTGERKSYIEELIFNHFLSINNMYHVYFVLCHLLFLILFYFLHYKSHINIILLFIIFENFLSSLSFKICIAQSNPTFTSSSAFFHRCLSYFLPLMSFLFLLSNCFFHSQSIILSILLHNCLYKFISFSDVLMALPRPPISPIVPLNSTISTTENTPCDFTTLELQIKEIERIFLRYNQQSKSLFKKFTDFATKRRYLDFHENLDISVTDPYSENWPLVEKLIFRARGIQVFPFF